MQTGVLIAYLVGFFKNFITKNYGNARYNKW